MPAAVRGIEVGVKMRSERQRWMLISSAMLTALGGSWASHTAAFPHAVALASGTLSALVGFGLCERGARSMSAARYRQILTLLVLATLAAVTLRVLVGDAQTWIAFVHSGLVGSSVGMLVALVIRWRRLMPSDTATSSDRSAYMLMFLGGLIGAAWIVTLHLGSPTLFYLIAAALTVFAAASYYARRTDPSK